MGSTLSRYQADLLTTHFDRVVLMLDGDKAGEDGAAAIAGTLAPRSSGATISLKQGTQPDQLPSREIQRALWSFANTVRAGDDQGSNLSERAAGAPSDYQEAGGPQRTRL